jgi:hypothetical protein
VKISPPLVITEDAIADACCALQEAFIEAVSSRAAAAQR